MSGREITPDDERKLVLATLLKSGSADGREDIRRYWRQRLDVLAAAPNLLAALENAFVAMGRAGANADTKHPLRGAWEDARAALAKAEGK